jgi:phosphoribosylformylglycinamidine synthase subunit PurQ / glutaminase
MVIMKPRVLILHANGTNRDLDAAQAVEMAGGTAEIRHINELRSSTDSWSDYSMLVVPGGFSYADALGAGKLLAIDLLSYFSDQLENFTAAGKPVLGICNGFQTLVKAGILPGLKDIHVTLTFNQSGHFECRWVKLQPTSELCVWTRGLAAPIECPVAHGEGNFVSSENSGLEHLHASDQVALVYVRQDGQIASGFYPDNPNGSLGDIAGICNQGGNVLGLMPHPENFVFQYQHPRWMRGVKGSLGLPLFENGIRYAQGI